MRTVLIIEDQFLESYELERRLEERGYAVRLAATQEAAAKLIRDLSASGDLAGVICDDRLLGGGHAALPLYRQARASDRKLPFVVYSGFPPQNLPRDDQWLRLVPKPFSDDAIAFVESLQRPLVPERSAA